MEIHSKILKIEDFCGNFRRYNGKHTNTIRMQSKKEAETFSYKTEDFPLSYV